MFDPVPPSARELARRVLTRVERGGAWATLALDAELERSGLEDRDRRLTSELVYGVLRHRSRLDRALAAHADLRRTPPAVVIALRVGAYQLLFLDRVPAHAAVDDAVSAARAAGGARLAGFANAVLRKLSTQREPALPADPRARLEVQHSMPDWIVDELAAAIPDEAELAAAVAALTQPAPLAVRANLSRADRAQVCAALTAEGATTAPAPDLSAGIVVSGVGHPEGSPSFRSGLWTVQDLGAQAVGELALGALAVGELVVDAPPVRILDACAGVGGKSTHLAERTGDRAHIDAADSSRQKLKLAAASARRLGLRSIHPVEGDLLDPALPGLAPGYDLVVLDAPCTGLGVLRRHPEAKWRLRADDVARMAELQAGLLAALASRVGPGGVLVYSVCTFTLREGPQQIERFLAAHPDFMLDPAPPAGGAAERRTWPHRTGADAFYMARLVRRA